MAESERKLKRGLRDVSTLFVEDDLPVLPSAKKTHSVVPFVRCVSVCRPLNRENSLATYSLANAIFSEQVECAVLSLDKKPPLGAVLDKKIKQIQMSRLSFDKISRNSRPVFEENYNKSQILFLDIEEENPEHLKKIVPILDGWIFCIPPTLEGIMESYRLIKAARELNQATLQHYLVFEDSAQPKSSDSFLFERFSKILSERLGINLVWLGYLNLGKNNSSADELDLENFFLSDENSVDAPAKRVLFKKILSAEVQEVE